jgi:hypothetical protein
MLNLGAKNLNLMKSLRLIALLAAVVAIAGCKKKDEEPVVRPDYGTTQLRIIHAGLGVGEVDLYADYLSVKQRIAANFSFGSRLPDSLYLPIESTLPASGAEYPRYVLYTHATTDTLPPRQKVNVAQPQTIVLRNGAKHSLFLVDSLGIKTYIKLDDPSVVYGADSVGVFRFVNTSNTTGLTLETTMNGSTVSAAAPNYGSASGYLSLQQGTYTFRVVNSPGVEMASRSVYIKGKKSVTLYYTQPGTSFGQLHYVYMD